MEFVQYQRPFGFAFWIFYVFVAFVCFVFFLSKVFHARERHLQPPGYARDVLLGIGFVLVVGLSGPLVARLWHPTWDWRIGVLFSGFVEWVYVFPALLFAKRRAKRGFRDGTLGAALVVLILDLIALLIIGVLILPLSGLH
jgi:hypothetical protein